MEDFLDAISRDEAGRDEYLKKFYFGDDSDDKHNVGLKPRLDEKIDEIDPQDNGAVLAGHARAKGEHREEVFVRVGKYGPLHRTG